jgi:hypothetical protein
VIFQEIKNFTILKRKIEIDDAFSAEHYLDWNNKIALENGTSPVLPSLSEAARAHMDDFLDNIAELI